MHTPTPSTTMNRWLDTLGYQANGDLHSLHGRRLTQNKIRTTSEKLHPYRREIDVLLNESSYGDVTVFDVGNVPTVCFVDVGKKSIQRDEAWIASIRQKIWNQGLISLLLVIDNDQLTAYPLRKDGGDSEILQLTQASPNGPFSAQDIQSGDIQKRHPDWFGLEARVDKSLLKSLKDGVLALTTKVNLARENAQFLLGQCLFVSYLEHRSIVSDIYRGRRGVRRLHDLIKTADAPGLEKLFKQLKRDFNGDFLDVEVAHLATWRNLPTEAFALLNDFLSRVDIETGQLSLPDWNYDFRYIPVELISGIYETFLGDDKAALGAYYTPRHLANFAVDQAFASSTNICNEVVYDGACGSGILLTTAFRRMICAKELETGFVLGFEDRCTLLLKTIRASDINQSACKLTAFSLYLSLLEDLKPNDIILLQDNEQVKLPPLIGKTIFCGETEGDFFASTNERTQNCTIFLSNPPWVEPKRASEKLLYEKWADEHNRFLPHRQIAAAFAHKSLQVVQAQAQTNDGRICLILPANLMMAPTSQRFLREWLAYAQIERVINFSDCRRLLFPEAIHPCVIVIAKPRATKELTGIPHYERIDYWVPKTDIGMVFGRLTVHGTDKHKIPAQEVWQDNQVLRTYLWGSDYDAALTGKLALLGTIGDLTKGVNPRWLSGCGFHHKDGEKSLPLAHLKNRLFLSANDIPNDSPVLDNQVLKKFPKEILTVASYGAKKGKLFKGKGVFLLFPSGATANLEIRGVFTGSACCFKDTVRAIKASSKDENLLRFTTMYLRSDLVRYFLLHTAYSFVAGRPKASLDEVENIPFLLPEHHPSPERAAEIIQIIAEITKRWEKADIYEQEKNSEIWKQEAQPLIFEYFDLNKRDIALVDDACQVMIPSVQPSSYANIRTSYSSPPSSNDLEQYVSWLMKELQHYKERLGGTGEFSIKTTTYRLGRDMGKLGIVRIALTKRHSEPIVKYSETAVVKLLDKLKAEQLLPMRAMGELNLSADFLVQADDSLYLIKPLVKRLWLVSQAMRDAQRIVGAVH